MSYPTPTPSQIAEAVERLNKRLNDTITSSNPFVEFSSHDVQTILTALATTQAEVTKLQSELMDSIARQGIADTARIATQAELKDLQSIDKISAGIIRDLKAELEQERGLVTRLGNALMSQNQQWGLYGDESKDALREFIFREKGAQ
jgi:hypothetical protein